ncbi:MAG: macro domain-containing protein [Sedimentisphaerales bacterium]
MKILVGDILKSNAQTIVNTVNCIGIMGKGIALEFKNRFPDMFKDYVQRCQRQEICIGLPYLYKSLFGPQIVNFPTKEHWKSLSKVNDIEKGLDYLVSHYKEWGIKSLAIPPLGCGNGQLEWKIVGPIIYKKLRYLEIPVEIYAPYGTNPRELTFEFLERGFNVVHARNANGVQVAMNPAWIALVEILNKIEQQPYHWPIGRTIFQKIAYVATHEGLPTGFAYQKGSFGPFSKDLKTAEVKLINNNLLQEERSGKMFMVKVGLSFEKIHKNYRMLFEQWRPILDKTTDLFMRMNTKQAEIVATVLYATEELKKKNQIISETEVLDAVMMWKQKRRPPLDKTEVALTIRSLGILHWIDAKPENSLPIPEEYLASV